MGSHPLSCEDDSVTFIGMWFCKPVFCHVVSELTVLVCSTDDELSGGKGS